MKEPITKFDLEAAFKALDEIDVPVAGKVKANKPALTEIFSRKTKFDTLMEEYYDVSDMNELDDAKEAREAEVAQAKLARIEKIVDLDAESPEDLLPSYVGKFIMQCPQCMTLFYKDPEDIEASEEDPDTVNVNEVCQHCGNESGYTLIGKVGEATQEEMSEYTEEETVDVTSTEEGEEVEDDQQASEGAEDEDLDIDLDAELDELDLDLEDDEALEKAEESLKYSNGDVLVEALNEEAEPDISADEFEALINSPEFKKPISDTEARAMMNDEEGDKENTKEAVDEAYVPYDDDILSDYIDGVMYYGKFLQARWVKDAPTVKDNGNGCYKVTHHLGDASVIVKFDLSNPQSSILKFTVDGKEFTTNSVPEAQDYIIKELEQARFKQFDIDLDESTQKTDKSTSVYGCSNCGYEAELRDEEYDGCCPNCHEHHGEFVKLEEGIFDKLKDKVADVLDNVTSKLKSREAKADWLLANAMKDYNDIEVDTTGQLVPDKNNQRFKTFVVIGYTSRDNKGNLIKAAPDFDDQSLVVGKNGVQYKDSYTDADNIAKGWSMVQGNGPAFIYLANGKDDDKALFLCEYFMGSLKNDQLEKYFKIVKDHIKGAKLMAKGGMSSETAEAEATKTDEANDANESLITVMNNMEDLQESSLEKFISDSLVESYGNVAGFRLAECAYENNKFTVDGTIFFTSGNKRKTSYVFSEAFVKNDKVSLNGLNEKLGIDKQFVITGYTDANKTFITESFKVTRK